LFDLGRFFNVSRSTADNLLKRRSTGYVGHPGDFRDFFIAHSSWRSYSEATRIAKRYRLRFPDNVTQFDRRVVSGYPFLLHSDDDFQLQDNAFAVLSGSIALSDSFITSAQISPAGLPPWLRALASSMIATSGNTWLANYQTSPMAVSGLEYCLIDIKHFQYQQGFSPGFVLIVDEIPGKIRGQDFTADLIQSKYFAIYDIPRIAEMYESAGYPELAQTQPLFYDRDQSSRVQILRARGTITTFSKMKLFIRLNNPTVVAQQQGLYSTGMAARRDLDQANAFCDGSIDGKVTSLTRMMHLHWEGINSPTYDDLPGFSFNSNPCFGIAHTGIPMNLTFPWASNYFDLNL
jgi:hypothetical protein